MSITANIFLLGYAYQAGVLPISLEAITQAITLNGAGSETNILGFAYGRLAAHNPTLVEEIANLEQTADAPGAKTLDQLILERGFNALHHFTWDPVITSFTSHERFQALIEHSRKASDTARARFYGAGGASLLDV